MGQRSRVLPKVTPLLAVGQRSRVLPKVTPLLAVGQRTHFEGILEPLQITVRDTDSNVGVSAPVALLWLLAFTPFGGKSPHTARKGSLHCVTPMGVKTMDLTTYTNNWGREREGDWLTATRCSWL